jgi:hypothetical protein
MREESAKPKREVRRVYMVRSEKRREGGKGFGVEKKVRVGRGS